MGFLPHISHIFAMIILLNAKKFQKALLPQSRLRVKSFFD
jgi:hypothetical protein